MEGEVWSLPANLNAYQTGGLAARPGPRNEAREEIWAELIEGRPAARSHELREALHRAWPLLDPAELVGDLWSVPAYLRKCAPWLTPELAKGLEFDVVVLVDPRRWNAVDRYVAMTRATRKLIILRGPGGDGPDPARPSG